MSAGASTPAVEGASLLCAGGATALVVAHPGHELRVHHWVELHRPVVCVLTDGSGSSRRSRLDSTARVLERAGAELGPMFGRLSDREFYQVLMEGDVGRFVELARELAALLVERGIGAVAGDAREGYNPAHDVCRSLIDAVCQRVRRPVENLAFTLSGNPREAAAHDVGAAGPRSFRLDDFALARKLDAARRYAELEGEVGAALEAFGPEAFRHEVLVPVTRSAPPELPPYYETVGEQRVRAGAYSRVLRYRDHVLPVERALEGYARGAD